MKTPCRPMRDLLSHSFWVPFSRLSYGALLSHGIWMQFRDFNTERGTWGCGFDAFLFFLAYVTFIFLFSFITSMIWEQPIAAIWYEFVVKSRTSSSPQSEPFYKGKHSVTAVQREEESSQTTASISDIIKSRKRQLEGKTDEEDESIEGNIKISRSQKPSKSNRKISVDTEDLEQEEEDSEKQGEGKKLYSFKAK